jgi:hypothetical protein
MAPKHDEIVRPQAGGWSVAWDATTPAPSTRRAFDKAIARNARALRDLVREPTAAAPPAATSRD